MARTVLTVQEVVRTGLEATYSAADAANNHSFDNTGENVVLHVKNGAVLCNVTIVTPNTIDGLALADRLVAVTATEERIIGPFPNALYGTIDTDPDPDIDPAIFVDIDDSSNVTLAALRLPDPSY
jgi:hypothetical protein